MDRDTGGPHVERRDDLFADVAESLGRETNTMLADHGIEVVAIPGSELGRGGARRLTCPIHRDGI